MPTHLVAGGAGFIGSHLCARLLERGDNVICVDNLSTGRQINIASISAHPNFLFLPHDLASGAAIPINEPISSIYNLASPASVVDYTQLALATMLVNSNGTLALLRLAREQGARFLMASTSEVYGNPAEHPQRETYWGNVNPNGPRSMYDESKRFAEALTMCFVRDEGVDGRIVRIFNTYGPHSRPNDGRVVPNFITQALRGEPLTIYGDGNQTRSFCYVADLVRGLIAAMDTAETCGDVFNLGNPAEYTILQFAQTIITMSGSTSGLVFRDLPIDDPERRKPDITKARQILAWEPRASLATGLAETIAWFRHVLVAEPASTLATAAH